MSSIRLSSHLSVFALLFSVLMIAGCIRSKPAEHQADSPVSLTEAKPGADGLLNIESGETYQVKFELSNGEIIIEVHPAWAPLAAARFKELVSTGFYDDCRFFRNVPGFMVQWGLQGDPKIQKKWVNNGLQDESPRQNNVRGTISYAKSGAPNSRTTQLFINYADNTASLNTQGFSPFAKVIRGMDIVDAINAEYGERPDQETIQNQGNAYLNKNFPNLDYIIKATLLDPADKVTVKAEKKEQPTAPVTETTIPETPKKEEDKAVKEEPTTKPTPVPSKEAEKKEPTKPETIEEVK
ncbi:MAG: peptidylprolyl isomerase [Planctomycetaceae bacterium]|nr:peptidylprolyl isomerase [Planctomycetaceae bacterium]